MSHRLSHGCQLIRKRLVVLLYGLSAAAAGSPIRPHTHKKKERTVCVYILGGELLLLYIWKEYGGTLSGY